MTMFLVLSIAHLDTMLMDAGCLTNLRAKYFFFGGYVEELQMIFGTLASSAKNPHV
jgi:hypothetical protein